MLRNILILKHLFNNFESKSRYSSLLWLIGLVRKISQKNHFIFGVSQLSQIGANKNLLCFLDLSKFQKYQSPLHRYKKGNILEANTVSNLHL